MAVREYGGGKSEENGGKERPPWPHEPFGEKVNKDERQDGEQYRHDPRRLDDRIRAIPGVIKELIAHVPLAVDLLCPGDIVRREGWIKKEHR